MIGETIKYQIDNYNGPYPIEGFTQTCPTKISGVYLLYNTNNELIYVGKSVSCIRSRLFNHYSQPPSKYLTTGKKEILLKKRQEISTFAFIKVMKNYVDIVERFLIIKYKPKHNKEFNYVNG